MRILLRVLALVALLVVAALVAAAVFLPDIVKSEAVRERIESGAEAALGRDVGFGALDFALLPPSLIVEAVHVAGATPKAAPMLDAERVALRIALLPLLARQVVIDSLVVRGASLHLVRTKAGIELPTGGAEGGASDAPDAETDGGGGVDLAVARVELRDCNVVLEDRAVTPAVTWKLSDLQVKLRGKSLADPVAFDVAFALASGGRIAAEGTAATAGDIDVQAKLDSVVLAPLAPYLPAGATFAGTLSGRVSASGPAANPTAVKLDATLADGRIVQGDLSLAGRLGVEADLRGGVRTPTGTFDIDATQAEVRQGGSFAKPAGDAATVSGRIATAGDGAITLSDVRIVLRNFEPKVTARIAKRTEATVDAPPFDLAGWEQIVPALGGYQLAGPVRIDGLAVATSPLDVRGALRFDGTRAVLPDAGPVRIDGALVGAGNVVKSENLTLTAGGEVIHVDATLSDLDGAMRYRVKTQTVAADTNRLVSAFSSKRDFIYGALDFDGDLNGSVGGAQSPLETLDGQLKFNIDKGRLKGVSILQLAFDRIGNVGSVAALASQLLGGPNLQPYYADDFKEIRGTFDVVKGVMRTDDMRIVYRDYTVDLRGLLRLVDLGIDMTGTITLGEKISAELGRKGHTGAQTLSLARVTGTLDDPKVQVSPEVAMAFVSRSGAGAKLDQKLGDALGGVLGGGSRESEAAPPEAADGQAPSDAPPPKNAGDALGDAVGGAAGELLKGVLGGGSKRK